MFLCVKETSLRRFFYTHTKHMFDRKKTDNNIFFCVCVCGGGGGGICIFTSLYLNFQYVEIKALVHRTSNFPYLTVFEHHTSKFTHIHILPFILWTSTGHSCILALVFNQKCLSQRLCSVAVRMQYWHQSDSIYVTEIPTTSYISKCWSKIYI